MSRIFVTSDTHFGHDREFIWGPRGFISHVEHDRQIIENWNSIVEPDDTVYHLGDVMLGDIEYGIGCLSQLNGHIKIIRGNHDTDRRWQLYANLPNVECIGWAEVIKYKKYQFYLSHHPTFTSNLEKAPYLRMHLINLYGHTHQQKPFYQDIPFMFHVGLDSNDNKPVLLDDAIELMKKETQKCLDMLAEQVNECDTCAHNAQCSASVDGKKCKDYEADPILTEAKGV